MKLILASKSPRRREILEKFGFEVEVKVPVDVEEIQLGQKGCHTPDQMVCENARLKALSVTNTNGTWILASDTTVILEGKEYGKPRDEQEAFLFLKELSGKTHEVFSSFCLMRGGVLQHLGYDISRVTFKPLTSSEIRDYMVKVHVMDKAGAYAVQEGGEAIISNLEGSFHNVMGLPIEKILSILNAE